MMVRTAKVLEKTRLQCEGGLHCKINGRNTSVKIAFSSDNEKCKCKDFILRC